MGKLNINDIDPSEIQVVSKRPLNINDIDPSEIQIEKKPLVSKLESGIRGAAQGLPIVGPWVDEATGLAESLITNKSYEQARDESRAAYERAAKNNPATFYGAQMAPSLALSPFKAIPVLGTGLSAAMGAIEGAGASEEKDLTGILKDAGISAGISAATAGIGNKIGKAAKGSSDFLKESAEYAGARALGAERSTLKSLGKDKVRQAARFALDEGIITPLASNETKIARNLVKKDQGGKLMGEVYDTLDNASIKEFNPLNTAIKVDEKIGDFYRSPINRGETNQLENTLESILIRGDGNISFNKAQDLKEELSKVANWKNKLDLTDKEKMARDAYFTVSDAIDDAVISGSKKINRNDLLDKLTAGKKLYSPAKTAETLLENRRSAEEGNKLISLTDVISASGAGGTAAAAIGAPAVLPTVAATWAAKKAAERYGANTSAYVLDKISKALGKNPEKLGRYSNALIQAANRGGNSLSAAHYVLQQKDPEYRKMIDQMNQEDEDK